MIKNSAKPIYSCFAIILMLTINSIFQTAQAQVEGLTLRTPPMTHAFIDSGDILVGIGLNYSKVEDPGYKIAGVIPDEVVTTEQLGFLTIGLFDSLAIAFSTNPTEIKLTGTNSINGEKVSTILKSSRRYYYLIPTLFSWQKNRIALIWGKGRATIEENTKVGIKRDEYNIGTTGLFGEFFLGEAFSVVPWLSWPYLLFDINPPSVAEVQTPDYGFDGILHIGEAKLSLSLIFQALETVDKSASDEELNKEESNKDDEPTQQSYAISLSFLF